MRSAALQLSYLLIFSLLSTNEARSLKSSLEEKASGESEKFINPMKTSENQQIDVKLLENFENYLNTMFKQWKKGSMDRSEDQSGTNWIGLSQIEEKLASEKFLAQTSLPGIVGLVGEELEGIVHAWENLLPDILACYASLSGGQNNNNQNCQQKTEINQCCHVHSSPVSPCGRLSAGNLSSSGKLSPATVSKSWFDSNFWRSSKTPTRESTDPLVVIVALWGQTIWWTPLHVQLLPISFLWWSSLFVVHQFNKDMLGQYMHHEDVDPKYVVPQHATCAITSSTPTTQEWLQRWGLSLSYTCKITGVLISSWGASE